MAIKRKKTPIIPTVRDVLPTPERMKKPDYESVGGGQRRRVNTLLALRKSGRINSEAESIAEKWRADYLFARFGVKDMPEHPLPSQDGPGDAHTRGLERALVSEKLAYVADIIGDEAQSRLVLLLIEGLSFSALADALIPNRSKSDGAKEAAASLATILGILPSAYRAGCHLQSMRRHEDRKRLRTDRPVKVRAAEFAGPS